MKDKNPVKRDLVILAADKDIESGIKALIEKRQKSLKTRKIVFDILPDWQGDCHCYTDAHETLRPFVRKYSHAIILFDKEGCGREGKTVSDIEMDVKQRMAAAGWKDRCAVVVFDPEFDILAWSDSSEVDEVLGWHGKTPKLREWLVQKKFLDKNAVKPERPKEALEAALREARKGWSASIFAELANKVGLSRCSDSSFDRLQKVLREWFPADE